MGFRNISAWSIRNPVPSIVLFLILTVMGVVSFVRMDINQQPDIDFPGVIISINQPGAAPSELETQVTQRVEAAIRSLEGIDEINSYVSEGDSTTVVQLAIGTPVDRAVNEARDAITQIRADLPDGITEPQVSRIKANDFNLGSFTAVGTDMSIEDLSWYIDNTVAKELLSVSGMGSVTRNGGVDREIRVILDPAKLAAQGLTASQINQQLRQVNLNAPGGRAEIAGAEQSVRVIGNADTAYTLSQTQINVGGGRTIRLADIATVRDLYGERRTAAAVDGRSVISFDFKRAKGASDVTVFREAKAKLDALQKRNPKVQFRQRVDGSEYALVQYKAAIHSMIEGALLAVLVVFLFLRDWRATFIAALAIPLSAIPAFWFMDMLGFTLYNMTMLALSLVAGVLVDDAIVEIENIVRHMRMGKTAYQASIDAADEIGLAVVATTFSIVAVFLPVALMPGIAGQFFKNFGMTVVVAVLMSLLVARLLTPMVAAYFLKAGGMREHGGGRAMNGYLRVLRWTLANRWKTVGVGGLAFALTIWLYATLPFTFQPPQNVDFSNVTVTMTPGTTLEQTEAAVAQATRIVERQPEYASSTQTVKAGSGQIDIMLKPDRARSSIDFERQTQPLLSAIPDARISFNGNGGGGGRDVSIMLAGDDPDQLAIAANQVADAMKTLPNLRAPRVEGDMPRPEITITPKLAVAADLGITTAALSQTIRIATLGDIDQNLAKFSLSDRQIPIGVALDPNSRRDLSTIENLPVPTSRGTTVPLKVVADIGFGAGPNQIQRFNQERRIVIDADLAPGAVSGEERAKVMALPVMQHLPPSVHYAASGDAKWQQEMIANFMIAVVAGVMLVLAVLVLLYRRAMPPFVNLGSLLLAPLGAAIALHVAGMPISLPVLIGLLMLLGIVAKNSILLIDFALEEMRVGVPPYQAIMEAGHKRAQPIVMTTVAMVAGMVPTALSLGADGSFNQPMAVTVIGGLLLSTLLTLLIVPAGFSLAIGAEEWVGPRLGRRLLSYRPGDEDGPLLEGEASRPAIGRGPGALPAAE
jgi:multidrug efflux pump subunit AcrB